MTRTATSAAIATVAKIYPINEPLHRPSAIRNTISTKTMTRRVGSIHALAGTRDAPQYLQNVASGSTPLPQFLQNGKPIPDNTKKVIVELKTCVCGIEILSSLSRFLFFALYSRKTKTGGNNDVRIYGLLGISEIIGEKEIRFDSSGRFQISNAMSVWTDKTVDIDYQVKCGMAYGPPCRTSIVI